MPAKNIPLITFEKACGKNWETLCNTFISPDRHEALIKKLKRAPSDCPDFLFFLIDAANTPYCKRPNYFSLLTGRLDAAAKNIMSIPAFLRSTFETVSDAELCFNAFIESTGIVYSTPAPKARVAHAISFFSSPLLELASPTSINTYASSPVCL